MNGFSALRGKGEIYFLRYSFNCRQWMPLFEIDYCGIYRLSFNASEQSNYFIWDIMNLTAWQDQPAGESHKDAEGPEREE
jgi:hypothetical protein